MKKIHSYLLAVVALLVFAPVLSAQTTYDSMFSSLVFPGDTTGYAIESNIGFKKNVSQPYQDKYWLKLEAYATGSAISTTTTVPADIILILDTSSSMDQNDYTYKGTSMKRWRALRAAVLDFVYTVYENQKENESLDPHFKGNRIAIVTYNRVARLITGGWLNLGEVVSKEGDTYTGSLITTINTNSTDGVWANYGATGGTEPSRPSTSGTRPDRGLRLAIQELLSGDTDATNKRADANLTVLLFTDGYPTDEQGSHLGEPDQNQSKFDLAFANNTLRYASLMKGKGAKLYTVGLIAPVTKPANPNATANQAGYENAWKWRNYCRVLQLMDWVSSNWPNAAWPSSGTGGYNLGYEIDNPFNGTSSSNVHTNNIPAPYSNAWSYNSTTDAISLDDFVVNGRSADTNSQGELIDYSTIVDENNKFEDIFQAIASQAGGSAAQTFTEESQAVDIVSSSFNLPSGTVASDIKVFTAPYLWNSTEKLHFGTAILAPESEDVFDDYEIVNGEKRLKENGKDTDVDDAIMDTENPGIIVSGNSVTVTGFDYADNWCGPIKNAAGDTTGAQGHKIIIMIPIENNENAVGGPNVATNDANSGIIDANGDMLVHFLPPDVALPVNIQIKTTGLKVGESAKYSIKRRVGTGDWEYVTSVFVTRHSGQGDDASTWVRGLPPKNASGNYQYMIVDDDWDWTYTLVNVTGTRADGETDPYGPDEDILTDNFAVNPIIFNNSKNDNIAPKVRYSESKATNNFKTGVEGYDDFKNNGRTVITVE